MDVPAQGSSYGMIEGLVHLLKKTFKQSSNECSLESMAQSLSKELAACGVHRMQWSEGSLRIPPLIGKVGKLFDFSCIGGLRYERFFQGCPSKASPLTINMSDTLLIDA